MSFEWKPSVARRLKKPLPFIPAVKHPLEQRVTVRLQQDDDISDSDHKSQPPTFAQGASSAAEEQQEPAFFDPLGVQAGASEMSPGDAEDPLANGHDEDFMDSAAGALQLDSAIRPTGLPSWDASRFDILERFTTKEKLLIVADFLDQKPPDVAMSEAKLKHKMEQLDAFDDRAIKRMASVTQEEYRGKIRELRSRLLSAWESDQRVLSIRVAIQAAKLLLDTEPVRFYPSKFVLVTDILDTFGNLVYARLFAKSVDSVSVTEEKKGGGDDNSPSAFCTGGQHPIFASRPLSDGAVETCRNWFFKIASIRELLPRFYMEAAILKSVSFIDRNAHRAALTRLAVMIRGISDPLVSTYARCYLARVVLALAPNFKAPLTRCLQDLILTQSEQTGQMQKLRDPGQTRVLIEVYRPAVEWIMHCLAQNSGEKAVASLMSTYGELVKPHQNKLHGMQAELFLVALLKNFHPKLVAPHAETIVSIVEDIQSQEAQANILRKLGSALVAFEPNCDQMSLLRRAWSVILGFASATLYITAAETWFHFAACHFSPEELNVLLGNIVEYMSADMAYEEHFPALQAILSVLLDRVRPFVRIFALDNFTPFVDLLQKDKLGCSVSARRILEGFVAHQSGYSNDVLLASTLLSLGKKMHDTVNELSHEDARQSTGKLLCRVMRKFRFLPDFQQQLTFFVDARGNFQNLDRVLAYLVRAVNALAIEAARQAAQLQKRATRKLAGFLRACIAYSYITIPSIADHWSRLPLYVESAQVALLNNCLPQADALLADCIKVLPTIPSHPRNDARVAGSMSELLSFLLLVPDNPQRGMLYFPKGILEATRRYEWSSDQVTRVHLSLLAYVSVASQPSLPYHIDGVDSNDRLYGSRGDYLEALATLGGEALTSYLQWMQGHQADGERLGKLALALLHHLLLFADVSHEQTVKLGVKLWKIVQKQSSPVLERDFKSFKLDLNSRCELAREGGKFETFKGRLKEG